MHAKSLQLCPTLCDPMDCSLLGAYVHGIVQARILEWVAISFSMESYQPRGQTWVSFFSCRFFTIWATRKQFWERISKFSSTNSKTYYSQSSQMVLIFFLVIVFAWNRLSSLSFALFYMNSIMGYSPYL